MRREGESMIEGPVSSMAGGKRGRTGGPGAALLPRSPDRADIQAWD